MGKFWAVFFTLTSVIIFIVSWMSPAMQWWFPGDHKAYSTLGGKIDDLFYLIPVIVSVTFVGTSAAAQVTPFGKGLRFDPMKSVVLAWQS